MSYLFRRPISAEFVKFPQTGISANLNGVRNVYISYRDLIEASTGLGDSAFQMYAADAALDFQWRAATVLMSLDMSAAGWIRSRRYKRLDPSEKGAMSYFLGMAQSATVARRSLGCVSVVHLEDAIRAYSLLTLSPCPKLKRRPDLVGYTFNNMGALPGSRIILEAKGRSNEWSKDAEDSALDQLGKSGLGVAGGGTWTSHLPNANMPTFMIATQAYFDPLSDLWKSRLVDPIGVDNFSKEWSDADFMDSVDLASALPAIRFFDQMTVGEVERLLLRQRRFDGHGASRLGSFVATFDRISDSTPRGGNFEIFLDVSVDFLETYLGVRRRIEGPLFRKRPDRFWRDISGALSRGRMRVLGDLPGRGDRRQVPPRSHVPRFRVSQRWVKSMLSAADDIHDLAIDPE